jgi:outer membrane protein OmpA-like peptidoglycan-associated protein
MLESRMARAVLILICGAIVAAVFLSLRSCYQSVRPDAETMGFGPIDNGVVELSDGSVMVARPGTISRDVIDWFNDKKAPPRRFDIGRLPFVPNSAVPAPETQVRLQRFATELKANPTVRAKVQVCTAGGDAADARLAALRAYHLKAALVANRIDADRISTETCRAGDARNAAGSASEQDGQIIAIVLDRQG